MIYDIMKIWRKKLTDSVNQSMNDEAVYRTAPATPGLLIKFLLPNSRFNQNLEGTIFAWLFVETLRLSRQEQTRLSPEQTILDKARPDQTRPELLDTMVDFPDTMVDLPDTMVDLPDTMVGLPDTMVDLPDTMVDLPNSMVDLPNTMVDLPN